MEGVSTMVGVVLQWVCSYSGCVYYGGCGPTVGVSTMVGVVL